MDAIQTYRGNAAPPSPVRPVPGPLVVNPAAEKTASNYLRALKRRVWMVLAVAVPLAVLGCIYSLRVAPVYIVKAEIEINAPDYDEVLSTLVSHDLARRDPGGKERYPLNRAAQLKSPRLQDKAVRAPEIEAELSQFEDPVAELFPSLTVMPVQKGSNTFLVALEGRDPHRTRRLLEVLLQVFKREAKGEIEDRMFQSEERAIKNKDALKEELAHLDRTIVDKLKTNETLGAGGKSIVEEQYVNLGSMLHPEAIEAGRPESADDPDGELPQARSEPRGGTPELDHRTTRDGAAASDQVPWDHEEDGARLQLRSGSPIHFPRAHDDHG